MYRKIMAVYSEIHTENVNKFRRKNIEFVFAKPDGTNRNQ
jgi:hypothetical protein